MKNKKAAGHVDWVISFGIFIIFLMAIIVFIKPAYKPTFESEALGEMIKNSFLEQNSRTIYRTLVNSCYSSSASCDHTVANLNNIGAEIYVTKENLQEQADQYKKQSNSVLFPHLSSMPKFWVYHNLNTGEGDNGNFNPSTPCSCSPVIGETTEYKGLKSSSITKFTVPNFPAVKEFNIKTRNINTGEVLDSEGDEPPADVDVYVYEFVYPILSFTKTPAEGYMQKQSILVSAQIW